MRAVDTNLLVRLVARGHCGHFDSGTFRSPSAILGSKNMARKIPDPPRGFDDLSVEQKLDYVQSLWNRITTTPEAVPVPDGHLQVINERLEGNRNSRTGRSWDEFREELREKLRRR